MIILLSRREARVVRKSTTAKLELPIAADADDREALPSVTAFREWIETSRDRFESVDNLFLLQMTPLDDLVDGCAPVSSF